LGCKVHSNLVDYQSCLRGCVRNASLAAPPVRSDSLLVRAGSVCYLFVCSTAGLGLRTPSGELFGFVCGCLFAFVHAQAFACSMFAFPTPNAHARFARGSSTTPVSGNAKAPPLRAGLAGGACGRGLCWSGVADRMVALAEEVHHLGECLTNLVIRHDAMLGQVHLGVNHGAINALENLHLVNGNPLCPDLVALCFAIHFIASL